MTYNPRIYLPYLRKTWFDSTSSTVFVQNASSSPVDAILDVYSYDGTHLGGFGNRLNGYGSTDFNPTSLPDFEGYGIASAATRYLAAAARVRRPAMTAGYTGFKASIGTNEAIVSSGDPATAAYLPMVKKYWFGHTSYIHVVNVESAPVNVNIDFWHAQGNPADFGYDATWTDPAVLQPGRSRTYDLHNINLQPGSAGRWLGSAVVRATSSSPSPTNRYLAALVADTADDQSQTEFFNASAYGSLADVYIPLVKNGWWGGTTGLAIMNWDWSLSASVRVIYYACYVRSDGVRDCTTEYRVGPFSIDPQRSYFLYSPDGLPPGFLGSAQVVNENGVPIVAIAQHNSTSNKATEGHPGFFGINARMAALPVAMKGLYYDPYSNWQSGIQVQNVGGTNITGLEVRYYSQTGQTPLYTLRLPDAYPSGLGSVNPLLRGRSVNYYAPAGVQDGFLGSVIVQADGQDDGIFVISNLTSSRTSTTVDDSFGFGGYPRRQ